MISDGDEEICLWSKMNVEQLVKTGSANDASKKYYQIKCDLIKISLVTNKNW